LAAWRVYNYDPFIGVNKFIDYDNDNDRSMVAQALQLAVWDAVYGSISVGDANDDGLVALYKKMIGLNVINSSFTGSGFMLAISEGSQDQLVAAPVPKPATMLLMGIGLLGLGVVGRKRIK
jgi:hypothetical protein